MPAPIVKIISLSNVYTRMMFFKNKGDVEEGHKHTFDHATLVSSGSVLYEVLDDDGNTISSKVFNSPDMVFVDKNRFHRITALEDGTTCGCIHALRNIDQNIIPPDSFIEPHKNTDGMIDTAIRKKTQKSMMPIISAENPKAALN